MPLYASRMLLDTFKHSFEAVTLRVCEIGAKLTVSKHRRKSDSFSILSTFAHLSHIWPQSEIHAKSMPLQASRMLLDTFKHSFEAVTLRVCEIGAKLTVSKHRRKSDSFSILSTFAHLSHIWPQSEIHAKSMPLQASRMLLDTFKHSFEAVTLRVCEIGAKLTVSKHRRKSDSFSILSTFAHLSRIWPQSEIHAKSMPLYASRMLLDTFKHSFEAVTLRVCEIGAKLTVSKHRRKSDSFSILSTFAHLSRIWPQSEIHAKSMPLQASRMLLDTFKHSFEAVTLRVCEIGAKLTVSKHRRKSDSFSILSTFAHLSHIWPQSEIHAKSMPLQASRMLLDTFKHSFEAVTLRVCEIGAKLTVSKHRRKSDSFSILSTFAHLSHIWPQSEIHAKSMPLQASRMLLDTFKHSFEAVTLRVCEIGAKLTVSKHRRKSDSFSILSTFAHLSRIWPQSEIHAKSMPLYASRMLLDTFKHSFEAVTLRVCEIGAKLTVSKHRRKSDSFSILSTFAHLSRIWPQSEIHAKSMPLYASRMLLDTFKHSFEAVTLRVCEIGAKLTVSKHRRKSDSFSILSTFAHLSHIWPQSEIHAKSMPLQASRMLLDTFKHSFEAVTLRVCEIGAKLTVSKHRRKSDSFSILSTFAHLSHIWPQSEIHAKSMPLQASRMLLDTFKHSFEAVTLRVCEIGAKLTVSKHRRKSDSFSILSTFAHLSHIWPQSEIHAKSMPLQASRMLLDTFKHSFEAVTLRVCEIGAKLTVSKHRRKSDSFSILSTFAHLSHIWPQSEIHAKSMPLQARPGCYWIHLNIVSKP